jgi:hypothetical protein
VAAVSGTDVRRQGARPGRDRAAIDRLGARGRTPRQALAPDPVARSVGYRGAVVPLLATLFTYLVFNVTDQVLTGPIAKHLSSIDISWIVGLIVSGGVYWLLSRSTNVGDELARAAEEADESAGKVFT